MHTARGYGYAHVGYATFGYWFDFTVGCLFWLIYTHGSRLRLVTHHLVTYGCGYLPVTILPGFWFTLGWLVGYRLLFGYGWLVTVAAHTHTRLPVGYRTRALTRLRYVRLRFTRLGCVTHPDVGCCAFAFAHGYVARVYTFRLKSTVTRLLFAFGYFGSRLRILPFAAVRSLLIDSIRLRLPHGLPLHCRAFTVVASWIAFAFVYWFGSFVRLLPFDSVLVRCILYVCLYGLRLR